MISDSRNDGTSEMETSALRVAVRDNLPANRLDLGSLDYIRTQGSRAVESELLKDPELNKVLQKKELKTRVRGLLKEAGEKIQVLAAHKEFKEKKGITRRALSFAWNHKILSAFLLAAAAAGGTAAGFYLTGNWELVLAGVGAMRKQAAAGIGRVLTIFDPVTAPLPGGGAGGVPGGMRPFAN